MINSHSARARRNYEEQKAALESAIESGEKELIHMMREHLQDAIENLYKLDRGTHFTQQSDPLVAEIVTGELKSSQKVIRK